MPRLDNSNPENLEVLREWGEQRWQYIVFNPDDPGDTPPIDVCRHCHRDYFGDLDDGAVAHPSYADDHYTCAICQRRLDEEDD